MSSLQMWDYLWLWYITHRRKIFLCICALIFNSVLTVSGFWQQKNINSWIKRITLLLSSYFPNSSGFLFFSPQIKCSNNGKPPKNSFFFVLQRQEETILKSSTKARVSISIKAGSVLVVQRKVLMLLSPGHCLSSYHSPMEPLGHGTLQPLAQVFLWGCLWLFSVLYEQRKSVLYFSVLLWMMFPFAWWISPFPHLVFVSLCSNEEQTRFPWRWWWTASRTGGDRSGHDVITPALTRAGVDYACKANKNP